MARPVVNDTVGVAMGRHMPDIHQIFSFRCLAEDVDRIMRYMRS